MPDLLPDSLDGERDHRLSQALALLGQKSAMRRNGAVPLVAVTCLMLSGALLITVANAPDKKAQAVVAAPGPAAPKADFEISGAPAAKPSDGTSVASGQEPQR